MPDGPRERGDGLLGSHVDPRASTDVDALPDVRDGLTRLERAILLELTRVQRELKGRHVPSALLYGRVTEHVNVSPREFQRVLARLVSRT